MHSIHLCVYHVRVYVYMVVVCMWVRTTMYLHRWVYMYVYVHVYCGVYIHGGACIHVYMVCMLGGTHT